MRSNVHITSPRCHDPDQQVRTFEDMRTYDTLSEQTREAILATLEPIADPTFRVQTAIYLIFTAPEYAVQI